ncbi:MAG: hypothetical protein LBC19_04995 [Tannerella sp.]|nr:hypothetical protein [Tannerella sp.]
MAGTEPDSKAPGYRTVIIRPIVAQKTDYVAASLTSPCGTAKSAWRKDDDKSFDFFAFILYSCSNNIFVPSRF